MRRVLILALSGLISVFILSGCGGGSGTAEPATKQSVSLSQVSGDRAAAEKAGAIAVRQYVLARLKTEKFITYDFSNADREELKTLIDDALAAWVQAEATAGKAEAIAAAVEAKEKKRTASRAEQSPQDWAEELIGSFDAYPAGKKIRGLAAQLGVDAQQANEQLELAKQIINSDAEADAEMYDNLMKAAMATKTVCKTGLFVAGVISTGGSLGALAGGSTSLMTAGGIIVGGADTLVDIGATSSTIILGENNRVTIGFNDIKEKLGPLSSVVGLMTFNPADTGEQLSYLGDTILDFVNDGKILGGLIKWENGAPSAIDITEIPLDGRTLQTVVNELKQQGFEVDEETLETTAESLAELIEEGFDISFDEISAIMDDLLAGVVPADDTDDEGGDTGGEDPGEGDTGGDTGGDDSGGDTGGDDDGEVDEDPSTDPGENDSDVPLTIGDILGYYNVTMSVANPESNPDATGMTAVIRIWQTDSGTPIIYSTAAAGYFVFDSATMDAYGSSSGEYLRFSGSITGVISISGYLVYGIPYNVSGVKIP